MSVDLENGTYKCWRCGARGYLTKNIAQKLEVSFDYVPKSIAGTNVDDLDRKPIKSVSTPPGYEPLFPYREVKDSLTLRRYLRYLKKRGVGPKLTKAFRIGVILDPPDKLWYTRGDLAFPLLDPENEGFIRRSLKKAGYFASEGLPREKALYNARVLSKLDKVYVVEGVFDVLGLRGRAVATLGVDISDGQLKRLARVKNDLIVAMDGDAWRASAVIARRLRLRGKSNVSWVKLPPATDPGSLGYVNVGKLPTL